MDPKMALHLIEVLVGLLAVAFTSWAAVVWRASQNLSHKFDNMMSEFRKHSLTSEHRITKLEYETKKILGIINKDDTPKR